jgi:prevent-host-death family protein
MKATVSDLKNRLSEYLRKVQDGETVVVFDRKRPVARLESISDAISTDERLQRLAAEGVVTLPRRSLPADFLTRKLPTAERSILEALLEERRDGR